MKLIKSLKFKVIISFVLFVLKTLSPTIVLADTSSGLCGILPCNISSPCLGTNCDGNALSIVGMVLELLLGLVFVGIFIYGIVLIIQASLKIVRSEGSEEEIQSGIKLVKGAYIGIILIIVGIVGLVVVFAIFNATDIFKVGVGQTPPGITLQ